MSSQRPTVSVVSPVYMAEGSVPHLVREVRRELEKVTEDYEVILVEDSSPDAFWTRIQ